jgi:hypothetical protein
VAWAGDGASLGIERPFAERAAIVRANVIDGKILAADPKQHHKAIFDLDKHFTRIGQFGHFGDGNEIRHFADLVSLDRIELISGWETSLLFLVQ